LRICPPASRSALPYIPNTAMQSPLCLLLAIGAVNGVALQSIEGVGSLDGAHPNSLLADSAPANSTSFEAFIQTHGRSYEDQKEYAMRFARFQEHVAAVHAQNKLPERRWTATVNHLADRTPEELQRLRGYRHGARAEGSPFSGPIGLVSTSAHTVDLSHLPRDFTWQNKLKAMQHVQDQGSCGSCWAVASSTVLRAHAELYQTDRTFSIQQIISCTPNPRSCGGTGGCGGATAELAMDYVAKMGLVTADDMMYKGREDRCPSEMTEPKPSLRSTLREAIAFPDISVLAGAGAKFGMTGWRKLPENKLEPLVLALYETGPVAVSVAAGDTWSIYGSGVMSACEKGAVVNHAVVLVGYGETSVDSYWTIQNSWGPGWGEGGFAKLLRLNRQDETNYCGWDTSPEQGTACKGGPKKVWVCGSCGILYDNVVPKFTLSKDGWWYKYGGRSLSTTI